MKKLMTVNDLRNPTCKSGFDHVNNAKGGSKPGSSNENWTPKWRATKGPRLVGKPHLDWRGPVRTSAHRAAQDYCDYVNGLTTPTAPVLRYPAVTVEMGTTKRHSPKQQAPPVTVTRPVFKGKHDLYDVVLYDAATEQVFRRKVGITANGEQRYLDICRTFGFSVRALAPAIEYPSKAAAEKAETAYIARVAKDPNWRQVGKECFAPRFAITLPFINTGGPK